MATQLHPQAHVRQIVSYARRKEIEAEITGCLQRVELLIARLDRQDAPLEDLEDDDPPGGAADDVGEVGSDDGTIILPTRPLYAVDQTEGPTNGPAAYRAWQRDRDTA